MKILILVLGTLLALNYAIEAQILDKAKMLEKQTTQEIVKYLDTKFEMQERGFQLDRISNMKIIEDGYGFDALFMNPTSHDQVTYTVEVVPKTGILEEDIRITQTLNTINQNLQRKYPVLSKLMGMKDGKNQAQVMNLIENIDLYRRAMTPKTAQATDLLFSFNATDFFNYLNSSDYIKYQYFRDLTEHASNFTESLKDSLMNFTMKDYIDLIDEQFGTKLADSINKTAIFNDLINDKRWLAKKSFVDPPHNSTADDLSQLTNQTRLIDQRGKNYNFESYYNFFQQMNKRNNLRRLTAADSNINDQDILILRQMAEQSELEQMIAEIIQKQNQAEKIDQNDKKKGLPNYPYQKTNRIYADKYRTVYDPKYKLTESKKSVLQKPTESKKSFVQTLSLAQKEQEKGKKRDQKEELKRLEQANEFEKQQQEYYAKKYGSIGDKYAEKYADKYADKYANEADKYVKEADKYVNEADKYTDEADKYVDEADKYVDEADKYVDEADKYVDEADKYADEYQEEFLNQSDPTRITNLDFKNDIDYQQYIDLQNKYEEYFFFTRPQEEQNQANSKSTTTEATQREIEIMTAVLMKLRDNKGMVLDKFDKYSAYWKELNPIEFESSNMNITIYADQAVTYFYNTLGYHFQNLVTAKSRQANRVLTDYNLVMRYKNQMEDVQHFMITMMIEYD